MARKRLLIVSGAALVALLLVSAIGVTAVFAQEPEPETEAPFARPFRGMRGFGRGGMMGRGGLGEGDGGPWTRFDTLAEALGLEPEELFAALRQGKSLEGIAGEQGVDLEAVQEKLQAERAEAKRAAIEQSVEDGKLSEEQAEWLLEGLDKGFLPRARGRDGGFGPGMGRGFGRGRGSCPCAGPEAEAGVEA